MSDKFPTPDGYKAREFGLPPGVSMDDVRSSMEIDAALPRFAPEIFEGLPPEPVGQRPRCQWCGRELRPNWRWREVGTRAGAMKGEEWAKYKRLDGYGGYGDSLVCGLRCGYAWAIEKLRGRIGLQAVVPRRK